MLSHFLNNFILLRHDEQMSPNTWHSIIVEARLLSKIQLLIDHKHVKDTEKTIIY